MDVVHPEVHSPGPPAKMSSRAAWISPSVACRALSISSSSWMPISLSCCICDCQRPCRYRAPIVLFTHVSVCSLTRIHFTCRADMLVAWRACCSAWLNRSLLTGVPAAMGGPLLDDSAYSQVRIISYHIIAISLKNKTKHSQNEKNIAM